jgi:hypothetical protein
MQIEFFRNPLFSVLFLAAVPFLFSPEGRALYPTGDYVAQIRRALGDDIAIDKSSSSCKRWKLGAGKNQCRS